MNEYSFIAIINTYANLNLCRSPRYYDDCDMIQSWIW
jgi:hypothetical protein